MRLALYRVLRRFGLVTLGILIVACSPQFDWRTIKNDAQGYSAMFPSKPQLIERSINYQQTSLKQTLEFAKVNEDVFAVMTTQIPATIATQVTMVEKMLQNTLLRQANTTQFNLVKDVTSRIGSAAQTKQVAQDFYLDLAQNKKVMRVRWLIRPAANDSVNLYQISVIRTGQSSQLEPLLNQENISIFFDEFRPN
jgi:hypothetical protein